jgi:hypothetical protein
MADWQAVLGVLGVYGSCAVLHLLLPATVVKGYVCDRRGDVLSYRLNGLRVLVAAVVLFLGGGRAGWWDTALFYRHYTACATTACIVGLLSSLSYYLQGRGRRVVCLCRVLEQTVLSLTRVRIRLWPSLFLVIVVSVGTGRRVSNPQADHHYRRALTVDHPTPRPPSAEERREAQQRSWLADFYLGYGCCAMALFGGRRVCLANPACTCGGRLEFNPRTGVWFDHKMFLYLAGAVMLQLVLLSAAAAVRHAPPCAPPTSSRALSCRAV